MAAGPLPKNLRRVVTIHELTDAERSEQLDYEPATLFIVEHVRCTYARPHCEGQVATAAKPAQPIDKGLPGPGLLAHVITEKYADHIPLYRQERRLARAGPGWSCRARPSAIGWRAPPRCSSRYTS